MAELLAEGERMPVYVHVIDHPEARVLVDTGMTLMGLPEQQSMSDFLAAGIHRRRSMANKPRVAGGSGSCLV
ncbi:hypothetical protein ACFQU3_19360 [Terrabacter sp. GCM10028922]|uniref:hypothetical protein n=1 Tax=Terrabacter sp. GCM10028922 TaxID=3273428 RepID=UPI00360BBDA2